MTKDLWSRLSESDQELVTIINDLGDDSSFARVLASTDYCYSELTVILVELIELGAIEEDVEGGVAYYSEKLG